MLKNKRALLLDRDGVLNEEKRGSYIFTPEEYIWLPGAQEAMVKAREHYDYFFIVTNQRGIARGLMTEEDLAKVHEKMTDDLAELEVEIHGIYYAKGMDNTDPFRKPNPGMGLKIKEAFKDIDWSRSTMIGNNISDMEFGKHLDLETIFLSTTNPPLALPHPAVDKQFASLLDWSESLTQCGP